MPDLIFIRCRGEAWRVTVSFPPALHIDAVLEPVREKVNAFHCGWERVVNLPGARSTPDRLGPPRASTQRRYAG